jgi:hypothetical protein
VVKVLGLAFTVLGIPALLNSNLILTLLLNETPHVYTVSVGKLIAVVLLVAWALITGALAWERSGFPVLIVGDTLNWDNVRYRLTLTCKEKPYDTSVRLLEIVDATGRHIVPPGRMNLDLEWTHHGGRGDVHIKANETETVSVATIREEGGKTLLRFTGATHAENILVTDKRAYFHLQVAHHPKPIERWFCFAPPTSGIFPVTNEPPPMLATS